MLRVLLSLLSPVAALLCLFSTAALATPATDIVLTDTVSANIAAQVQPPLTDIYKAQQFAPLWLDDDEPDDRAEKAIELMSHAADDALNVADYQLPVLQQQLDRLKQQTGTNQQLAAFDLAMSRSVARYISDLNVGRVNPRALGLTIDITPKQAALQQHLITALTTDHLAEAIDAARPIIPQYATLRQLLTEYRVLAAQHPAAPTLPPLAVKKLTPGESWVGASALADWLITLGYLPTGTTVNTTTFTTAISAAPTSTAPTSTAPTSTAPTSTTIPTTISTTTTQLYDGAVVDGVKNFQLHHGQIPDGVLGKQTYSNLLVPLPERVQQIELAMERLRWLDDSILKNRFVIINIPQFTLWGFSPTTDGNKPVLQMPVVVGQAGKNETPLMIKNLSSLVFSPYWNVPRSIAIKEILPKLEENPFYLVNQDMELVDGGGYAHGSEVGETEYSGIVHGEYRIRQRSGKKNALGELKFVFPNDDSIYMHDTPSKSFFAKERRDLSHGCVRLGNPMAMALFALQPQGEWDEAKVREKISVSNDQHLALKERMPVLLLYITANVDADGKAVFLQDIYKQDGKLVAALRKRQI